MKKIYLLLLICFTISCKQEAQTPEKFINTINKAILSINNASLKTLSNNVLLNDEETLKVLDSIKITINEHIDKVESLQEINDSLMLKKELLIYLENTDKLISDDFTNFLKQSIESKSSDSKEDLSMQMDAIQHLFKKALKLIEKGKKIQAKILIYHKIYNIPVPDYLKEANQE